MKSVIKRPEILGPEQSYVSMLDEAMQSDKETEDLKGRVYIPLRPSASGNCSRELGYQLMEYRGKTAYSPEKIDPRVQRIFSLGHAIEAHLLRHFGQVQKFKVKYKQQVLEFFELPEGDIIEGSLDMCFISDDHKCIGDVKSKGDKFSISHKSNWDQTREAYAAMSSVRQIEDDFFWIPNLDQFLEELYDPYLAANFLQLNLYATSDFIVKRGIDHAVIIQYNKNDSRVREFRFKPSMSIAEKVKCKFLAVANAIDEQNDPDILPRDFEVGSVKCAYCHYKDRCRPGIDTQQAFFDSFPSKEWPTNSTALAAKRAKLESLYEQFKDVSKLDGLKERLEGQICDILQDQKVTKIRFADGAIYHLKWLKSKKGNLVLRRGKL